MSGRGVVVALDGKERHLRFTFNALCRMEQSLGTSVNNIILSGLAGFVEVRALMWAALLDETPNLTVEEAGNLIGAYLEEGGSFIKLASKMVEALERSGLIGKPTEASSAGAPLASASSSTSPSEPPSTDSGSSPATSEN